MSTTTLSKPKTTDTLIQVRVPAELKRRTAKLFEEMGTTTSAVIKMMLVQADETKSIPFKIRASSYPLTANEVIDEIKATFEMEDMPLSDQNIKDLQDIELAKVSTEEVRQKILADIKRRHKK